MNVRDNKKFDSLPIALLMLTGGVAGSIGEIATIPLDTAKVRMQVQNSKFQYRSMTHCLLTIIQQEGALALYKGLSAGVLRQMVYGSLRIGLYKPIKDFYSNENEREEGAPIRIRIAAAVTTGALGILIANPTDVVKVRLQGDGKKRREERRFVSLRQTCRKIMMDEGVKGFWTGVGPNMIRNGIINSAEIATFDLFKDLLILRYGMEEGVKCHIISSAISGLTACLIGSPVDVVKNRMMNARVGHYSGVFDCVVTTLREGPLTFYKGLQANAYRIVSWNMITFVSLGYMRSFLV